MKKVLKFTALICAACVFLFGVAFGVFTFSPVRNQYVVQIEENASFIEFHTNYEIIEEYDDGTFLIEEK